jgi:hypothetical protein
MNKMYFTFALAVMCMSVSAQLLVLKTPMELSSTFPSNSLSAPK